MRRDLTAALVGAAMAMALAGGIAWAAILGSRSPRHFYWANYGTDTLGRADLDGNANQSFITAASGLFGVAIDSG